MSERLRHVCGFCGLPLEDNDDVGLSYPDAQDAVTRYHDPICWYWAHFGDDKRYNVFTTTDGIKWWLNIRQHWTAKRHPLLTQADLERTYRCGTR